MSVERLLLINVGTDPEVSSIPNDGAFPALGVISLATAIRRHHPQVEVRVVDGQVTPFRQIEALLGSFGPDLVGMSVLGSSYGSALRLAAAAKEVGALTVFGNDHAAILGDRILRRQDAVDFVCTADVGEFSLSALVASLNGARPLESVPRVMYRSGGQVVRNGGPEFDGLGAAAGSSRILDEVAIPERTLSPADERTKFLNNYNEYYGRFHGDDVVTGVATMNRARGCARAKSPCVFCGIADLSPRFSSPELFWEDVRSGMRDVGASIFYEAFDSFSSAPRWVERLVRAKPRDIGNPGFFVYSQAAETTPGLVGLYRSLGVFRVNMGLESGDTAMLRRLKGPADSLARNQEACRLYKDAGITIYGSLVLGGPGETQESLGNTVRFARWLVDNEMMAALQAQPLYPDMGAISGRWLMDPDAAREASRRLGFAILDDRSLDRGAGRYGECDRLDFDELSREWNRIFSHVSWEGLLQAAAEISDYAERHGIRSGSARISNAEKRKGVAAR